MPAPVDFQPILDQLKTNVASLAQTTLTNYVNDAKKDGQNLIAAMQEDLERWTKLLAEGSLTTSDFEWLVNSQTDSLKMAALEQAGLAAIRIDQFKNSVLNLVVDTIFNLIKI